MARRAIGLALLLAAAPALANGYGEALVEYRRGVAALEAGELDGAIQSFAAVLDHNPHYGYAAAASLQVVRALELGAERKAPGFEPLDVASALKLVRFALALAPEVDAKFVEASTCPDQGLAEAYRRLAKRQAVGKDAPIYPRGDELAALVKKIAAAHQGAAPPRIAKELATIRTASLYEAQLAMDRLVMMGDSLSTDERIALFKACAECPDTYRGDSKLEALLKAFPDVARGIEPRLEALLVVGTRCQRPAAARALARAGDAPAMDRLLGLYERALSGDEAALPTDEIARALRGFPSDKIAAQIEKVLVRRDAGELPRGTEALARFLFEQGEAGHASLVKVALDPARSTRMRVLALETLQRRPDPGLLPTLRPLAKAKGPLLVALLSYLGACDGAETLPVALEAFEESSGDPEVQLQALRAIHPSKAPQPAQQLPFLRKVLAAEFGAWTGAVHATALERLAEIPTKESLASLIAYSPKDLDGLRSQLHSLHEMCMMDAAASRALAQRHARSTNADIAELAKRTLKRLGD